MKIQEILKQPENKSLEFKKEIPMQNSGFPVLKLKTGLS